MEKHIEALWRRVSDALKPLKKGLVELFGGEEEVKPVPVRVEREVSKHKSQQRSMWSWAALLLCLSACGGPNNPIIVTPPVTGPPPVVNMIAPTSGPLAGGTLVTIFGENFDGPGGVEVLFGTRFGTNVSVLSSGEIRCLTPIGFASESVTVTVLVGAEAANSPDDFFYESVPRAELEILWKDLNGLLMNGVLTVDLYFEETPLTVSNFIELIEEGLFDDTLVHGVTPYGDLVAGDFENGDGTGGHAASFNGIGDEADPSTWRIPDEIDASPVHAMGSLGMVLTDGPDSAGSVFYIVGEDSDFAARDGVNTVFAQCVEARVNGSEASVLNFLESLSNTELDGTGDPVFPVQLVEVRMTTDDGPTNDGDLPSITLLDPSFGPPEGGYQAIVFGENFGSVADPVPSVYLNSIEILDTVLISDQALLITVPSGTPGSKVTLEVMTAAGSAVQTEAMHYFNGPAVAMGITWTDAVGLEQTGGLGIELYESDAPLHVDNFIQLAAGEYYDGVSFHRVIDGFMIQGGDFQNGNGTGGHAFQYYGFGDPNDPNSWTVPDEADNGLTHFPGVLSMAKTSAPNSGGSQFFFVDAGSYPSHLDGVHTVFGSAQAGYLGASPASPLTVIDEISQLPTNSSDVPLSPVLIDRASHIVADPGLLVEGAILDAVSVLDRRMSQYSPWNVAGMSAALQEGGQRLSGTGGIYSLQLGAGEALRLLTRSRDSFKGSVPVHFFGARGGRIESESWADPRDEERDLHQIVTELDETVLVIFSPEAVEWSKAWVSDPAAPLDW